MVLAVLTTLESVQAFSTQFGIKGVVITNCEPFGFLAVDGGCHELITHMADFFVELMFNRPLGLFHSLDGADTVDHWIVSGVGI